MIERSDNIILHDSDEFKVRGYTYRILDRDRMTVALIGYSGRSSVLVPPKSVKSPTGIQYRVVQIGHGHLECRSEGEQAPIVGSVGTCIPHLEPDFSTSLRTIVIPPYIGHVLHLDAPSITSFVIQGSDCGYRSGQDTSRLSESHYSCDPSLTLGSYVFANCPSLEDVILSERITAIPEHAFVNCHHLRGIIVPDSVKEIGVGAFEGCYDLNVISLPSGLKAIPDRLFNGCGRLSSIDIPDGVESIGDLSFFDCRALRSLIIPDSVTSIGEKAFQKCLSLRTLVIGDGVISINNSIFDPFPKIEDLTLGSGIKEVEEYCFVNWHNLRNIVLSEGLETICDNAFESCDSLVSITIPATVKHIGGCVFCIADSLESISVMPGNEVYSSYDGCIYDKERKELILCPCGRKGRFVVPDGVERIRMGAFEQCEGITEVYVPDSVTELEDAVFSGCSSLKHIRLPKGLETLGYSQLSQCYALESIDLDGVREIGQYALAVCTSLKEVVIPDSVEGIDRNAFRGCSSLERVIIGKGVSFIAAYSFIACPSLKEVVVDPDNLNFMSVDGVVYTKDMRELVLYPSGRAGEEYTIPSSVEEIRAGSLLCTRSIRRFSVEDGNRNYVSVDGTLYNREMTELIHCPISDIKEYTIPAGVEHVHNDAFSCSKLESVVFPEGVRAIGGYAFYNCTSLKEITLPKGLLWIDQRGFYRCTSLDTMYISGLTPSFEIMYRAFAHCPYDMSIVSAVEGCELHAFELDGTMLYPLPEGGLRHFEGVLGLMWECEGDCNLYDEDGGLLDDASERWKRWASGVMGK